MLSNGTIRGIRENEMKTIVFTGMDEKDLNQQQFAWLTSGTTKIIVKQWPDELLPITAESRTPMTKLAQLKHQKSRRVDYQEQ